MRFELKLVDIELKNFRLFENIKVNLDNKLTVLIGENGAGKTALLEGIAKALNVFTESMKTASTDNFDLKKIYQDSDIRYGQKEVVSNIQVAFLEKEKLLPEEGSLGDFENQLNKAQSQEDVNIVISKISDKIETLQGLKALKIASEELKTIFKKKDLKVHISAFKDFPEAEMKGFQKAVEL